MITLFQLPAAWGLPSISMFCVKTYTFLRLADLPFKQAPGDLRQAPKGKVPYIDDDGQLIGDSGFIQAHCERKYGNRLDAHLSPQDHALGHLVRRTCEESTYNVLMYVRWASDAGFASTAEALAPAIPAEFAPAVREQVLDTLKHQGVARHSPGEVDTLGAQDLDALSSVLGDKQFLLGHAPTSYDTSLYALVSGVLATPHDNAVTRHARSLHNLVAYAERVAKRIG